MTHTLMKLPFELDALEPYISKETLEYHYGKHHAAYVNKLNNLIEGTKYENMVLKDIIKSADGGIFNNAAQVFNHDFYFNGLCREKTTPSKNLLALIERDFGTLDALKETFLERAAGLFGSGWVWLSINSSGDLVLESLSNAENPLFTGNTPLLTCDVWEHAYYVDYRNARPEYLKKWWDIINWDFVSENLDAFSYSRHGTLDPCSDESEVCKV